MVEIIQHEIPRSNLLSQFNKMEEISISMNKELIQKDIDRLNKMLQDKNETKNRHNKKNIQILIDNLKNLYKHINQDSIFEMCWNTDKELPYTYPMTIMNERLYGIDICNYIEIADNEKVVQMDMMDLADIIAFEIMSRDLGETHESIENILKNCGIIGFEPSTLLTDIFKENNEHMYYLSKALQIGDTPYYSYEDKLVRDYFSSKKFKTKYYKDVVEYSCRYANTLIVNAIMKNGIKEGIPIDIIELSATDIVFIVKDAQDINIKDNIIEDISVRAFGRRFRIEPGIQIF